MVDQIPAPPQKTSLDADDDTLNKNFNAIVNILMSEDKATVFSTLNQLENRYVDQDLF